MVWTVLLTLSIALLLSALTIEIRRKPESFNPLPTPRQPKLFAVTFKGNLESRGDARSGRLIMPIVFLALLLALLWFLFGGAFSEIGIPPGMIASQVGWL